MCCPRNFAVLTVAKNSCGNIIEIISQQQDQPACECLYMEKLSTSEGSKSSTHYLSNINRFDVSSKDPSSGITVRGRGKHACFYTSEYIKTTRDKIETNQMDLIKTRNK